MTQAEALKQIEEDAEIVYLSAGVEVSIQEVARAEAALARLVALAKKGAKHG